MASTRMHDDGRSERCKYCATLLLTAMHQNIYTALKLHTWQTEKVSSIRLKMTYGIDACNHFVCVDDLQERFDGGIEWVGNSAVTAL